MKPLQAGNGEPEEGVEEKDWDRQRAYYDPERTTRSGISMNYWRRYGNLLWAVTHAPIALREKARLYRYLGRKMKQQRRTPEEGVGGRDTAAVNGSIANSLICGSRKIHHNENGDCL